MAVQRKLIRGGKSAIIMILADKISVSFDLSSSYRLDISPYHSCISDERTTKDSDDSSNQLSRHFVCFYVF